MAYTVLARKYRSQTFDDIVGQEAISQTLKNAIKTKRIAHAYLFSGTRGIGKTTMARVLAKALNCLSTDEPTTEPCCKCESCVAVNAGEDIDVIEIDGASNRGIDNIRELRQNAVYRPARSRFKIYIIDEVHMLTNESFNALLKILEEPPAHVKFIFATTEPNKVIATIQSRCQRFDFNNIGPQLVAEQLKKILKQEKIKYEDDVAIQLGKMADGSMRDGLSLLDRLISTGEKTLTLKLLEEYLGCASSEKVEKLIEQVGNSEAAGILTAIEDLSKSGMSEVLIADAVVNYMRDLLVVKASGADNKLLLLSSEQKIKLAELCEKFDIAGLIYNITVLEKLRWSLKSSDTSRALLEASLLRLGLSEHFINAGTLLSQPKVTGNKEVKKKSIAISQTHLSSEAESKSVINDNSAVEFNWQEILNLIGEKLGNGTKGLLSSASAGSFANGVLAVSFPASAVNPKKMCESNGRAEKIESALSDHFGKAVKLKFETADKSKAEEQSGPNKKEAERTGENKLIDDPAVRTVLLGLGGTITGVEKDN